LSKFESEKHNNADFIDWLMTVKSTESKRHERPNPLLVTMEELKEEGSSLTTRDFQIRQLSLL